MLTLLAPEEEGETDSLAGGGEAGAGGGVVGAGAGTLAAFVGVGTWAGAGAGALVVLVGATPAEMAPVSRSTSFGAAVLPEKNSPAVSAGSALGAGGKMSDWKESAWAPGMAGHNPR